MRFGSVCSGIEAASVAWPFWEAAWFSEIEPFPCAVLKHHYPEVPNHGDMTMLPDRILSGEVEAPDVFCGGTPCQAFSVAGNRKSLDDARGNLSLTFCEIADAIDSVRSAAGKRPAVIFWENVPGCRNTKDNFFGCFLAKLCGATEALEIENGKWPTNGIIVGERRRVAWATLDARWFGLAQRRKRVFVVAYDNALVEHFGMPCPSEILSLGSCLPRNPKEGGKTRQGITADAEGGIKWPADLASTLNAAFGSKQGLEDQHINGGAPLFVPHPFLDQQIVGTLTAGFGKVGAPEVDAYTCLPWPSPVCAEISPTVTNGLPFSRTGNERVECDALVSYGIQGNMIGRADTAGPQGNGFSEEVGYTLTKTDVHGVAIQVAVPMAIATKQMGQNIEQNIANTLAANDYKEPQAVAIPLVGDTQSIAVPVAAFKGGQGSAAGSLGYQIELSPTLNAADSGSNRTPVLLQQYAVRRLTPVECERLQGFPDGYTNIPWRNKPEAPDGPRYKALGNSWAVPVVRWIGERINNAVNRL